MAEILAGHSGGILGWDRTSPTRGFTKSLEVFGFVSYAIGVPRDCPGSPGFPPRMKILLALVRLCTPGSLRQANWKCVHLDTGQAGGFDEPIC